MAYTLGQHATMRSSPLASLLLLSSVLAYSLISQVDASQAYRACKTRKDCGWNNSCVQGQCLCNAGFKYSANGRDCTNADLCGDSRCVDCYSSTECRRCIDYVEESTGHCLDQCDQQYRLVVQGGYVGKVCRATSADSVFNKLSLSIVIGIGLGMVLVALIVIVCCTFSCRRETGQKVKTKEKDKERQQRRKERQFITQFVHENHIYESTRYEHRRLNEHRYRQQVAQLRPHMDTFLVMLKDAKRRLRLMPPQDSQRHSFRNIIPELCRVISLLNDYNAEMPADGILLLQWAQHLLQDYLRMCEQQEAVPQQNVGRTVASTFKPEHRLVEDALPCDRNSASTAFKYERFLGPESLELAEIHSIKLSDGNLTDPIEV